MSKNVIFLNGPMKDEAQNKPLCIPDSEVFLKYERLSSVGLFMEKEEGFKPIPRNTDLFVYRIEKIASGYPKGAGQELYGARLA